LAISCKEETERFASRRNLCIEQGQRFKRNVTFWGRTLQKPLMKFANAEGKQEYVWGTSWGVSTRLMGALVMTHSDDKGLVL
jgi:prolyl-tRNA synthetase